MFILLIQLILDPCVINVLIRFVKDPVSSKELFIIHSQYSTVENSNSDLVSYIDPEKIKGLILV